MISTAAVIICVMGAFAVFVAAAAIAITTAAVRRLGRGTWRGLSFTDANTIGEASTVFPLSNAGHHNHHHNSHSQDPSWPTGNHSSLGHHGGGGHHAGFDHSGAHHGGSHHG